jgi:hypothetical protein
MSRAAVLRRKRRTERLRARREASDSSRFFIDIVRPPSDHGQIVPNGEGFSHYADVLDRKRRQHKDLIYGRHIAPHDIQVRELGSGRSRIETAESLGIRFEIAPQMGLEDGINAVRMCSQGCISTRPAALLAWKLCRGIDAVGTRSWASSRLCPSAWCRSGAPEQRWLRDQAAMAGRLMGAVSLIAPRVSRLM